MKLSDLFWAPNLGWGLRGDPYLWEALERRFADADLPSSTDELVEAIRVGFFEITGHDVKSDESIFVEEFAHGGMSSGHVCPEYWRETAIPLLVRRFERILRSAGSGHGANSNITKTCEQCGESLPEGCFRMRAKVCVWCAYSSPAKRATARYSDKKKGPPSRLNIDREAFVDWYIRAKDQCEYCGLTFEELRTLRIRRNGGYCVAWDIDRIDSSRPYEEDNLALSCFVCNMAKGDQLSYAEAKIVGRAVRRVWDGKLKDAEARRQVMDDM